MRLPSRIFFAYRFISYCKKTTMRQYATFPLLIFIVNIAATLEMQTSSTEFRALYPSLMRLPSRIFFACYLSIKLTNGSDEES